MAAACLFAFTGAYNPIISSAVSLSTQTAPATRIPVSIVAVPSQPQYTLTSSAALWAQSASQDAARANPRLDAPRVASVSPIGLWAVGVATVGLALLAIWRHTITATRPSPLQPLPHTVWAMAAATGSPGEPPSGPSRRALLASVGAAAAAPFMTSHARAEDEAQGNLAARPPRNVLITGSNSGIGLNGVCVDPPPS